MGDRLGDVRLLLGLGRLQLAHRLVEPGAGLRPDAAAAGVDIVRHRPHPRLRGEQRLVVGPPEPLGGLPFLGDGGQQPVQVGVRLGQLGERPQRVGAAVALGGGHGPDRGVARGGQLVGLGQVALRQLRSGLVDPVLDVGDRSG